MDVNSPIGWESRRSRGERKTPPSAFSLSTFSLGLDAAIIAVPSDAAVQQALQLVRGAGQVLLFAHTKRAEVGSRKSEARRRTDQPPASETASLSAAGGGEGRGEVAYQPSTLNPRLDFSSICLDEKDLIGSYSSDFTLQAEVARLVFSRRLDVRGLISHHFPLDQTAAAVALAAAPTADSLKIVVDVDGNNFNHGCGTKAEG